MSSNARLIPLTLIIVSCSGQVTAPLVRELLPPQGTGVSPVEVELRGEGFSPNIHTDFGHHQNSSIEAAGFSASLIPSDGAGEPWPLSDVRFGDVKSILAVIPAGVPRGVYDLSLIDPAGRQAVLPHAYRVVSASENVAAFQFEMIRAQQVNIAFTVAISAVDAQGTIVDGFTDPVTLSDRSGTLAPVQLPPFVLGALQARVTLSALSAANALTATDALGHAGSSNEFEVRTGLPVRLAFTSAPLVLGVGECSSRLELELQDAFGDRAVAEAPIDVGLSADPSNGFAFFADAACTQPMPPGALAPGASTLSFFFQAERAGTARLHASSVPLPTASQEETLVAAPPVRLVFSSAAQVVAPGACSAPVAIGLRDRFDNATSSPGELLISLDASQGQGLTLYADEACATPTSSVTLAAGAAQATFSFQFQGPGPDLGTITATAPSGSGLLGAAQSEGVNR